MSVHLLDDLWYAHVAQIQVHFLAVLCAYVLAIVHQAEPVIHTELDAQGRRLLAVPWQHLGLNLHSIRARIRWYQREEEAGGF